MPQGSAYFVHKQTKSTNYSISEYNITSNIVANYNAITNLPSN